MGEAMATVSERAGLPLRIPDDLARLRGFAAQKIIFVT
jgi:hypothetical protein